MACILLLFVAGYQAVAPQPLMILSILSSCDSPYR